MKFRVTKTSHTVPNEPPVEGAVFETVFEKFRRRTPEGGLKTFCFDREVWTVEVESLAALIELIEKTPGCSGEFVLDVSGRYFYRDGRKHVPLHELEVYDDYRE